MTCCLMWSFGITACLCFRRCYGDKSRICRVAMQNSWYRIYLLENYVSAFSLQSSILACFLLCCVFLKHTKMLVSTISIWDFCLFRPLTKRSFKSKVNLPRFETRVMTNVKNDFFKLHFYEDWKIDYFFSLIWYDVFGFSRIDLQLKSTF